MRRPPRSTLFPYATLVRARLGGGRGRRGDALRRGLRPDARRVLERAAGRAADVERRRGVRLGPCGAGLDRKSTRLNSSHANISYAVFCLKKKNTISYAVFV